MLLGIASLITCMLCIFWAQRYFRLRKTTNELLYSRNTIAEDYCLLLAKYERVQNGYNQGALEGTRQAYTNARAFMADEMQNSPPREKAFLVTWLHPRLSELGAMEHKLLMDMKGLAEAEQDFKDKTANKFGDST